MNLIHAVCLAGMIALCGCAATAVGSSQTADHFPQLTRGHDLALEHCSSCHAVEVRGDSPAEEAPPFREITNRFRPSTLNGMLRQGISHSYPAMPWFEFSETDAADLSGYLRSMQESARTRPSESQ